MEWAGQGIIALADWVIPVWTVAVGMIGLFIWLYVLKKKHGWAHWRVAPPRLFARAVGWVLWVVAKKIPWKPILIWGPWVLMLLGVGFYSIENWRGKRTWDRFEAEVKARGRALEFAHYFPEMPDEENVIKHPAMGKLLAASRTRPYRHAIAGLSLERIRGPKPDSGTAEDLRGWIDPFASDLSEEEAARRVLEIAEPSWSDLELLAEALTRSGCRVEYDRREPFNVQGPEGLSNLQMWSAGSFRARSILNARLGRGDDCATDLSNLRRVGSRLVPTDSLMACVINIGVRWLHGPALWEALRVHALTEEQLVAVDNDLREIDHVAELGRVFQLERCMVTDAVERMKKDRKKGIEMMTEFGGLVTPLSSGPAGVWEWVKHKWYYGELRFGPRGWFDAAKATSGRNFSEWIDLAESGDAARIREKLVEPSAEFDLFAPEEHQGLAFLAHFEFGASRMVLETAIKAQTGISLQRAAVALERHWLKHGRYPETSTELTPEYLEQWPKDLTSGEALGYELKDDGTPRLLAVGTDGERGTSDDQGWQYTPGVWK